MNESAILAARRNKTVTRLEKLEFTPKKEAFQEESSLPSTIFQGTWLVFGGVHKFA